MTQSSSTSGIFSQGEGQPQVAGNSQLSSNFGNSLSSLPEHARSDGVPVSGGVTNTVLNSVTSSGPSVGASSLVTDANSGLSGAPHLQRSTSINTESYTRLPASPISFSSDNISISGNSIMDRSSIVQQRSNQDPSSQHSHQSQQHQGTSSATSLPRMGQVQLSGGPRMPNSFVQDPTMYQLHKKPRLDIKQEDIVQQHLLQQLLQRQDPMNLQNSNSQVQSLIHQQRLRQKEEQILQSMSPVQRVQFLQQQQQHQQLLLRQQLQEQGMPSSSAVKRPYDDGICSRRLMQYLYHQRQRPRDDAIDYWRKFVAEYYSPRAKKRWCLSLYDKVGHHSPGVFPQAAMDTWQCDICGSKSGKGFEATFEVLPRLNEIKFSSGVIDELLFLDFPRERRFPSGMMMLEYAKAIQESVYEQLRVVREGQLRIFFTPDLKIFSWEFCARRHEELLPRRLVAPQVNQLLQVAEKCQNTISQSGPDGVSQSDLQANNAMVVTAGLQLARSLELQSLNDFGFPKRYVRCLQIADVVNSMKDLMDFCRDQKKGPIESLKNFPEVQMRNVRETDQFGSGQGLRSDSNSLNKLMTLHPELNNQVNNNQHMGDREAALAYNNYQNMMIRQNSINSTNNSIKNNTQVPRQQQLQQLHSPYGNVNGLLEPKNQSVPPQRGSQAFQQQMIQQYLRDMSKNNGGTVPQQNLPLQNPGGNTSGGANLQPPSRSNRAASSSNSGSPAHVGHTNIGFGQRALDLPQSSNYSDQIVSDISHEFTENGFFSDLDDDMNFNW